MTEVVKTPVTAGEVAGEAGPVNMAAPPTTVLKPGGNTVDPEPVHWNALLDAAPSVVRKRLLGPPPGQVAKVVNDHPAGALTVIEVIAYALVDGFFTVTVKPVAVEAMTAFGVAVSVGRAAFCAALTGAARGTKNRKLESARRVRIVPELNFVRYAFVGVFILFSIVPPESGL